MSELLEGENVFDEDWIEKPKAFECDGMVTEVKREVRNVPEKGDTAYLIVTIQPTSYEGEPFNVQYAIRKSWGGKWARFTSALRKSFADAGIPFKDENSMVGCVFHWKKEHVILPGGRRSDELEYDVYLPVQYIKKEGEAPKPASGPTAPAASLEERILDWLKMHGASTRKQISAGLGVKMTDVVKSVGTLLGANKVKLDGDNVLIA